MLGVEVHRDARSAAAAVELVAETDPIGYTLLATVHADAASGARSYDGEMWVVVLDDEQPVGAAMLTPPHPLYVGPMPDEAAPLVADVTADTMAADGLDPEDALDGVNGEAEAVRAVVRTWQQRFPSVSVTGTVPERLHKLESLSVPDVPGEARIATDDDRHLLLPWSQAFAADIGHQAGSVEEGLRVRLEHGGMLLWTVNDATVSMAGHTRVVRGVTRIGPVYTPPEHRGHGYGAAVTAAATAAALGQPGAVEVTLFTDLRNPTSNKIYSEIGYRPVRDYLEVGLSTGS